VSQQREPREFREPAITAFAGATDHATRDAPHEIRIGKAAVSWETGDQGTVLAEVFTMTIGSETIELLPFKIWTQLDVHKWKARGLMPRTPTGLEITWDQLKVAGETVSPWDPDACDKVEKAINQWLALERQSLEINKEKSQVSVPQNASQPDQETIHFKVDLGNAGQPRLKCLEGDDTVKVVALNLQGLNALIDQGLMRKPKSLKVGAFHDWVEMDGELFRFKEGGQAVAALEKALNEKYSKAEDPNGPGDVEVSPNPASPTGFDIQFAATPKGLVENRKWHLNEETIQLLQDPERCRVLRKGITARLTPPDLVFKVKTAGGGEAYLEPGPSSLVSTVDDNGQPKTIDLSQGISLLNLNARELTVVFNHPAINRRAYLAQKENAEQR
jgi:hypothetical protein